jgi:ComF family protein
MRIAESWHRSSRPLLDFLFPPECPLCHEHRGIDAGASVGLCNDCRRQLVPRRTDFCLGCGAPLGPYQRPSSQCIHCYRDRFAFSRAWSLGRFDGELRPAILKAKAKHGELLAVALADLLFELHREQMEIEPPDIVIAVPHHWTERLGNRHQASQTAAMRLAMRLGRPLLSGLVFKQRRTRKQAMLNATDRRKNLADAFRLRKTSRLQGKRVLLVDDVLTTGTTTHRVASLLIRQGGAEDVRVCALARAVW